VKKLLEILPKVQVIRFHLEAPVSFRTAEKKTIPTYTDQLGNVYSSKDDWINGRNPYIPVEET